MALQSPATPAKQREIRSFQKVLHDPVAVVHGALECHTVKCLVFRFFNISYIDRDIINILNLLV